jgi:hypothetical protein
LQNFNFILLKMQCCDVSCVKQARVLPRNEIRKIVMVADSDEHKHYVSKESKDADEPRPPSWWCSISWPPSPNYSAGSRRIWPYTCTTYLPPPELFDDLPQKKNSCCGTVRLHRKGMSKDLKPKTLILKRGDNRVKTRGDLTAMVWKEKRVVCLLTFTIHPEKAIIAMNMGTR